MWWLWWFWLACHCARCWWAVRPLEGEGGGIGELREVENRGLLFLVPVVRLVIKRKERRFHLSRILAAGRGEESCGAWMQRQGGGGAFEGASAAAQTHFLLRARAWWRRVQEDGRGTSLLLRLYSYSLVTVSSRLSWTCLILSASNIYRPSCSASMLVEVSSFESIRQNKQRLRRLNSGRMSVHELNTRHRVELKHLIINMQHPTEPPCDPSEVFHQIGPQPSVRPVLGRSLICRMICCAQQLSTA